MLIAAHRNHFLTEGFSCKHIPQLEKSGVRSLDAAAAFQLNLRYGPDPITGIWFPYAIDYGQVRVDNPLLQVRYLSPKGSKSQAWKPSAPIITEGWKDAAAATWMGGIETGAIPGVCHYQLLPRNSQQVILFDADGWTNPDVFSQLIKAGLWVNGKIQLVPKIDGNPKAGLLDWLLYLKLFCERSFSTETLQHQAYQTLIQEAQTPVDFLATLPIKGQWGAMDREDRQQCIAQALKLSRFSSGHNRALIQNVTMIDREFVSQFLSDRANSQYLDSRQAARPRQGFALNIAIPIEKCLCRENQELLDRGVERCNNPRLFRLATDLVGVATALENISQNYYGEPAVIFGNCAKRSGLSPAEIQGIWKSANSRVRMPSVPLAKMLDRIRYWRFSQSG